MNGNGKLVKILVNSGITGIALVVLAVLWFVVKDTNELIGNHMNENTKALIRLEATVDSSNDIQKEQIGVLRSLREVIRYR